MVDLGRDLGAAGDLDQLVHSLQQPVAFAAHVRDVHAAVGGRLFAEGHQLVGLGVKSRGIDEGGADA